MSEIQRYDCWGYESELHEGQDPTGQWVKYTDHAAEVARLESEIAALRAKLEESQCQVRALESANANWELDVKALRAETEDAIKWITGRHSIEDFRAWRAGREEKK